MSKKGGGTLVVGSAGVSAVVGDLFACAFSCRLVVKLGWRRMATMEKSLWTVRRMPDCTEGFIWRKDLQRKEMDSRGFGAEPRCRTTKDFSQ